VLRDEIVKVDGEQSTGRGDDDLFIQSTRRTILKQRTLSCLEVANGRQLHADETRVNRAVTVQGHGRQRPIKPYIKSFTGMGNPSKVDMPDGWGLPRSHEGSKEVLASTRTEPGTFAAAVRLPVRSTHIDKSRLVEGLSSYYTYIVSHLNSFSGQENELNLGSGSWV
jgi:hypothetical protein